MLLQAVHGVRSRLLSLEKVFVGLLREAVVRVNEPTGAGCAVVADSTLLSASFVFAPSRWLMELCSARACRRVELVAAG